MTFVNLLIKKVIKEILGEYLFRITMKAFEDYNNVSLLFKDCIHYQFSSCDLPASYQHNHF